MTLRRLLPILGINAVPIAGLAIGGWSASTALAVYWIENLVGALTVALRIAVHRRLTGKRGHFRPHLGVRVVTGGEGSSRTEHEMSTLLAEFLTGSLLFTLAHGVILSLVLVGVLGTTPEPDALWAGALGVAAFQLLSLAADLVGIKDRPFAWIKEIAQVALGRVVLIHLAILGGFALAAWSGGASSFFLPFAGLKLLADLGSLLGQRLPRQPAEHPPRWLAAGVDRLKPGGGFAAHWAETQARELALAAEDEGLFSNGVHDDSPPAPRRPRPARRRR